MAVYPACFAVSNSFVNMSVFFALFDVQIEFVVVTIFSVHLLLIHPAILQRHEINFQCVGAPMLVVQYLCGVALKLFVIITEHLHAYW